MKRTENLKVRTKNCDNNNRDTAGRVPIIIYTKNRFPYQYHFTVLKLLTLGTIKVNFAVFRFPFSPFRFSLPSHHYAKDSTEVGSSTKQDKDVPDGMEIVAVIVSEEIRSCRIEQTFGKQEDEGKG